MVSIWWINYKKKGIETEVKWLKNKETRINFKLTDNKEQETK